MTKQEVVYSDWCTLVYSATIPYHIGNGLTATASLLHLRSMDGLDEAWMKESPPLHNDDLAGSRMTWLDVRPGLALFIGRFLQALH